MKVVIAGAGRVGWQLARQLIAEDKQVALVESIPDLARQASERLDCQVITGQGNSLSDLKRAGIEQANFFVSVTESDEVNMVSCSLVSAEYPELLTVARVRNLAYSSTRMVQQRLYGIDHIINPEIEAARAVISSLEQGALGTVMPFGKSGLSMASVTVDAHSALIGESVKSLRSSISGDFIVSLVIRESLSLIPSGDTLIQIGDVLYIIADKMGVDDLMSSAALGQKAIRKIAIAGGGRIGRYVAEYLLGDSETDPMLMGPWTRIINRFRRKMSMRNILLIEKDYEAGRELAERYPNIMIINADISDEDIGDSGVLEGYDLLISATGNQELNLISALHARNLGIKRSIALVRKSSYIHIARQLGVDVTVSVTDTMVDSILRILRKGNIQGIHSIAGSNFEVIDFILDITSPMVGIMVKNLKMPKDTLILMVNRVDETIIPHGDLQIVSGDRLFLITPREAVKKLEKAVSG